MQYSHTRSINKIAIFSNIPPKMLYWFFTIFAVIFSYTISIKTAHAGLFSFISDLAGDEASAQTLEVKPAVTSQNMALLQTNGNLDVNSYKNNDDHTAITSGNALMAEIGPQGTVLEVQDEVPTEISIYTVREGDSLSKIAELFNVSVNTIIWANDLGKNPTIKKDQVLVILPISGIRYTVKKGDTIRGIVIRYKTNLEEVLQYNDLTVSSTLKAGDIILIPDADAPIVDTPKPGKPKSVGTNPVHDAGGPFWVGYFIRPIEGGRKSQGLHGYNGVDLAAPVGTVIRASAAGTVIASISNGGWNGGYGNYVIISHKNGDENAQTLYAHNQKNFVKVGDTVVQGQMIAKVGMTGKTTGPHVHFEIRGAKNPF